MWSFGASQDVPYILDSVAELAAGHTSRERVVADSNLLVHKRIGKAVVTLCHGTNEDADALLRVEGLNEVATAHERSIEAQGHLAAIRGQVVSDGVLDHTEKLLVGVGRANGKPM